MASDEEEGVPVPRSRRAEWSDVRPIPQDDGPNPVVSIAYKEDFRETMDYFRALYFADERSSRSLGLTSDAIHINPANYTVWHFRRLILERLNINLWDEMQFVDEIAMQNTKNYQIWHHRRWLADKLGGDAKQKELQFTEKILELDSKNYHAWSHRQWVLQALGGWEEELDYCKKLLEDDIFNNSAWNQRYFVVTRSPLLGGLEAMRSSETEYALNAILYEPNNECPWRYLRGLYKGNSDLLVSDSPALQAIIEVLKNNASCVFALGLVLDLLCYGLYPSEELKSAVHGLPTVESGHSDATVAHIVCSVLRSIDPMRSNYWTWRQNNLPPHAH